MFEFTLAIFGITSSFMYHICDSFNMTFILNVSQWHRLDNVGVISSLGVWFVHFSCFSDPLVDISFRYSVLFVTLILQQAHPFDLRFTVTPLLLFALFPTVKYCLLHRQWPSLHLNSFITGLGTMLIAVPFFILGQNECEDPYRFYHGLWHFFGGAASFFLWTTTRRCPFSRKIVFTTNNADVV